MFFSKQTDSQKAKYEAFLVLIARLSHLFSDSSTPYLYYRIAEKIFCQVFQADDLSRSDVSVDAKKMGLGIGLKTFLAGNYKTFQKVTEFGASSNIFQDNHDLKRNILKIAQLRNERILFTQRVHDIENSIYHCVIREDSKFSIHEELMDLINIDKITNIKRTQGSIRFEDDKNEYLSSFTTLWLQTILKSNRQANI